MDIKTYLKGAKLNTSVKLGIRTLSPVHIGTDKANSITKDLDYVLDEKADPVQIIWLDKEKLYHDLNQKGDDEYTALDEYSNILASGNYSNKLKRFF